MGRMLKDDTRTHSVGAYGPGLARDIASISLHRIDRRFVQKGCVTKGFSSSTKKIKRLCSTATWRVRLGQRSGASTCLGTLNRHTRRLGQRLTAVWMTNRIVLYQEAGEADTLIAARTPKSTTPSGTARSESAPEGSVHQERRRTGDTPSGYKTAREKKSDCHPTRLAAIRRIPRLGKGERYMGNHGRQFLRLRFYLYGPYGCYTERSEG